MVIFKHRTYYDHDLLINFVASEHLNLPNTIANVLSDHTAHVLPSSVAVTDHPDVSDAGSGIIMSTAERSKLGGIETNATADQSGSEIKALYEAEANTNAYTDAEKAKLGAIEASATADQSDSEIETGYNNQVSASSQAEMETGTETAIRRMSPLRVAQAISALGGGGVTDHGALTGLNDDDHSAIYYNQTILDSWHIDGSGNANYILLTSHSQYMINDLQTSSAYAFELAVDADQIWYLVPLPITLNGKDLYIDTLYVSLRDADSTDYISVVRLYAWAFNDVAESFIEANTVTWNTSGAKSQSFARDVTSAYQAVAIGIGTSRNGVDQLDIGKVLLKYYYA